MSSSDEESCVESEDNWNEDDDEDINEGDDTDALRDEEFANLPLFERLKREEELNKRNAESNRVTRKIRKIGMY